MYLNSYTRCLSLINYEEVRESEGNIVRAEIIILIRNKRKSSLVCALALETEIREIQ